MTTSDTTPTVETSEAKSSSRLFQNRNYLWLWASAGISCLGDYFTLVAMPWLVLTLTHDSFALGTVMALESLPRAAFMLVSGGVTDRYSARTVLFASRTGFMLTLIALVIVIHTGHLQLHHLYGFAIVFGLLTAFALPANRTLLPQVVNRSQIQQANSALMGSQQLIQLFAPVLAGLMIWGMPTFGAHVGSGDLASIANAFAFNACAIFFALFLLTRIKIESPSSESGIPQVRLTDGFRYLGRDRGLRIATMYMACVGFFAIGPLLTVIPLLAEQRLHDGALSYGMLYAVNGLGSLLGFACGGMLPKPGKHYLGLTMFSADLLAGVGIFLLGHSTSFLSAAPALALIGLCASYGGVLGLSWIQGRVPQNLCGRVLGIVTFAVLGMTPVSMALGGLLISQYSLTVLLDISGCVIAGIAVIGLLTPGIHRFATYPSPESETENLSSEGIRAEAMP
ncbi:MFS transporter [Oleiagrimonas citrea]|uniref:MFS transporter n=1 Tax=Oleiagrimonas citrea TaxID=1665687 RepID=A0A846ZHR0_9GAMM|nr:MFS transporter [Oleiagrimonas citrea]NKZ37387.1 MFS transporter [Oleiagrimonas citrea]